MLFCLPVHPPVCFSIHLSVFLSIHVYVCQQPLTLPLILYISPNRIVLKHLNGLLMDSYLNVWTTSFVCLSQNKCSVLK